MIMQMEDLNNKARHIQILKLTKEIQAVCLIMYGVFFGFVIVLFCKTASRS